MLVHQVLNPNMFGSPAIEPSGVDTDGRGVSGGDEEDDTDKPSGRSVRSGCGVVDGERLTRNGPTPVEQVERDRVVLVEKNAKDESTVLLLDKTFSKNTRH